MGLAIRLSCMLVVESSALPCLQLTGTAPAIRSLVVDGGPASAWKILLRGDESRLHPRLQPPPSHLDRARAHFRIVLCVCGTCVAF
jgi:hypothetical protein